jgi:N-methylhydantoinase A
VGPRSAGADPGPACYLKGGELPTLTDANLALGRIDPDRFLGGGMPLSVDAALRAIERHCAKPLGLDVAEVAAGIVGIATASMARAVRLVTVERGHNPAGFALLAFGGAGPLHAAALAAEVGFAQVVVPQHPGVLSAAGLLVAPVQVAEVRTALSNLESLDARAMADGFEALVRRAVAAVAAQGVEPADVEVIRALDLRYRGQSYELTVAVDGGAPDEPVEMLTERFHDVHERTYGHAAPGEPVEIVNWRVTARKHTGWNLRLAPLEPRRGGGPTPAAVRTPPTGGPEVLVFDRADLRAGDVVRGPAVIAEPHATTFVPQSQVLQVDRAGTLWITVMHPGFTP